MTSPHNDPIAPHLAVMERLRDSEQLKAAIERARRHVMTPAEKRAQKRSWIRGQTGATEEFIIEVLPELAP